MASQPPRFLTRRYLPAATLHPSAEAEGFGAANLLDEARTQLWRADNALEAWVDIDLGQALPVNALAVIQHNLSYDGQIGVWAGAAQGGSELLDLTVDAWECLWGVDECAADEHGADGYPTDEERLLYFPAGPLRLTYLDALVTARWWRARLIGPTWADDFNPDGLIQAGLIVPGFYFQAGRRVCAPLNIGPDDDSRIEYAEGGQHWRDEGPRYRAGRYPFHQIAGGQALGAWYDLLQEIGSGNSLVADFFPAAASQVLRLRNQLYCHLTKLQPLSLDRTTRGGLTLEARESY